MTYTGQFPGRGVVAESPITAGRQFELTLRVGCSLTY